MITGQLNHTPDFHSFLKYYRIITNILIFAPHSGVCAPQVLHLAVGGTFPNTQEGHTPGPEEDTCG